MNICKEKIQRFLHGKYSYNDYLSVSSFFKEEGYDNDLKKYMKNDWFDTDSKNEATDMEHMSRLLNKVHHCINLNHKVKRGGFWLTFQRIAAVLIIPTLITIAVMSYKHRQVGLIPEEAWVDIHSPIGARAEFKLPDGTQGWLNFNSSLKYPVNFLENRTIEINGEVWLDVVHQNADKFKVITPYFNVEVLGTKLNIFAYENETTAKVILEEGKIAIVDKEERLIDNLVPDQQIVYDKLSKELTKTNIDSKIYTNWRNGLLVFRNVSMNEIVRSLERKYNAEFILHGDSLKSSIFRVTFQDESLEEICKAMAEIGPVKYKIHKQKMLADSSFTKTQVEMWLKKEL